MPNDWPALPYTEWLETYETLHLYTQIPGKIKLALSPFLNEWWHVAYNIWARGITTGPIPYHGRLFEIRFDFLLHRIEILDSAGISRTIELIPRPVAEFYSLLLNTMGELGIEAVITDAPQEMPEDSIPLDRDTMHHAYDRKAVERFWHVLSQVAGVFERFRSGFSGKASPVYFWWGSFDLALARFCGRPASAPPHSNRMARVGGDEEHYAAGFWPGDARLPQAAFYAYSYPQIAGLETTRVLPGAANWNPTMGEFILPYDDVRAASDPGQAILEFLASTYEAVANLGKWNRAFLERKIA